MARGSKIACQRWPCKKVRVGPRGAIMLNCNSRKRSVTDPSYYSREDPISRDHHGFHMSFRKPISGALGPFKPDETPENLNSVADRIKGSSALLTM